MKKRGGANKKKLNGKSLKNDNKKSKNSGNDRKNKIYRRYEQCISPPNNVTNKSEYRNQKINELWGITTFFNPSKFTIKYKNYQRFRKFTKAQGLQLCAVELSFDGEYELQEEKDAEILVKIQNGTVMWQKERLLNLALTKLPENCRKVCWIDADLIFENDNWVYETSRLLDHYRMIQPFQRSYRLEKEQNHRSITSDLKKKANFLGVAYEYAITGSYNSKKQTGYVWAIRKKIIDQIGFYDRNVIGGGDRIIARSAFFPTVNREKYHQSSIEFPFNKIHLKDIEKYMKQFNKLIDKRVFFTKGYIHHMWHGDYLKRQYVERHYILKNHNYDPNKDIKIGQDGCMEWNTNKSAMIKEVKAYFKSRQEDE